MLIAIIIVISALTVKIIYDYRLWLKKEPVNHPLEWLIMAIACAYPIFVFTNTSDLHHCLVESFTWWIIPESVALVLAWVAGLLLSTLTIAAFIWFFFDGFYNVFRGENWWFTGTPHPGSAKSDQFLRRLTIGQHILLKGISLIGSTALYLLTYR